MYGCQEASKPGQGYRKPRCGLPDVYAISGTYTGHSVRRLRIGSDIQEPLSEHQTSNLGVGSSNLSERANDFIMKLGGEAGIARTRSKGILVLNGRVRLKNAPCTAPVGWKQTSGSS